MELKSELIQHLSKEIETHTSGITDFRAKTSFTLLVGPFIVLGSFLVLAKTLNVKLPFNKVNIALLIFMGLCFMAMGYACSRIEKDVWDQNNRWRAEIRRLSGILSEEDISQPPHPKHPLLEVLGKLGSWWRRRRETGVWRYFSYSIYLRPPKRGPYEYNGNLFKSYFWFYFLILLTFACGGILFSRLEMPPSASANIRVPEPLSASTSPSEEQPPRHDASKP